MMILFGSAVFAVGLGCCAVGIHFLLNGMRPGPSDSPIISAFDDIADRADICLLRLLRRLRGSRR